MKKSLSFITFAIFFSMTAHAEVVQVIANADTQIEADQTSLLLGTMGEDGSVARCEMKFDAKTYARTLSKGDVFLIWIIAQNGSHPVAKLGATQLHKREPP